MPKYYIFAYDEHEEFGGVHDLRATVDNIELHAPSANAERILSSLDTTKAPYGYWERAHIATINGDGDLVIIAEYYNRRKNRDGRDHWVRPQLPT